MYLAEKEWLMAAEWVPSTRNIQTQAVMHEPVKVAPKGELGAGLAAASFPYRASYHTAVVMYSHASFHKHRLDSVTASSQLKVDSSIGQNHPLAPQTTPLK